VAFVAFNGLFQNLTVSSIRNNTT